jgi:1,2-diacylglycerol 3-alpha-glucosyltransferase
MDIAWFTDTWFPTRDGVVASLALFKEELEKKGHTIHIFAPGDRNDSHGTVHYYRAKTYSPYPQYRFPSFASIFAKRTRTLTEQIQPTIVHSHSPGIMGIHALRAASFCKRPLAFTYHTFVDESIYLLFENPQLQRLLVRGFRRWLSWYCARCACIIAPSEYVRQHVASLCTGSIAVIPTGIRVQRFGGGNASTVRNRFPGKKLVLTVGRLVREKNIDVLIEAAPAVLREEQVVFIVVGEGPARVDLERKARDAGLAGVFVFTGFVSDRELMDHYAAADVFAFPSTYETQGIVALEAMAAGLPVVAARAKALPEFIVDGENGFLIDPANPKDVAAKIMAALRMNRDCARIVTFAERYDIEKMAERLLEVYRTHASTTDD